MARVTTSYTHVDLDGDYGDVEGVAVTCDRCGHTEEAFGTSESSLRSCAVRLKENCPRGENNYYVID
jgi:hypothetical protein